MWPSFDVSRVSRGIEENAAAQQNAVHFGYQAVDPAYGKSVALCVQRAAGIFLYEAAYRRFPMRLQRRVDGEFAASVGNLHVRMRQGVGTGFPVQRKTVHACTERHHHHADGPEQRVAGGHLLPARLQKIRLGRVW